MAEDSDVHLSYTIKYPRSTMKYPTAYTSVTDITCQNEGAEGVCVDMVKAFLQLQNDQTDTVIKLKCIK